MYINFPTIICTWKKLIIIELDVLCYISNYIKNKIFEFNINKSAKELIYNLKINK